ncbi:MAG: hypothetical protein QQN63_12830 [Nitrosopumilus sp.]
MDQDIESRVRSYRDVGAIIGALVFMLFPLNFYLLVSILNLSMLATFATLISIQALTIVNILLGSVLYRRHLRKEVNVSTRSNVTKDISAPEVKYVTALNL